MTFGSDMPAVAPDSPGHTPSLESALADLIASRIAHEVVGPVGAISNGLELMEELGADAGEDALKLVADSARQAAARLQFYRMAYGRSGFEVTNMAQLRAAATAFFDDAPHHDLSWPLPPVLPALGDGAGRILLILTELAKECLVRGGTIRVTVSDSTVEVAADGKDSHMEAALADAIAGRTATADLSPRSVHGALAGIFARDIGYVIAVKEQGRTVTLSLSRGDG